MMSKLPKSIRNNGGGVWNHSLFWELLAPVGTGGEPSAELAAKIDAELGGMDKFKADFDAAGAGQFGSGWAWLIVDTSGKLKITKTPNGSNPIATGEGTPILGADVWEHSYYLDFRNRRPDYLTNFLDKLVNWEFVAGLLAPGEPHEFRGIWLDTAAETLERVAAAVGQDAWVSDGNYGRVRDLVWSRATHLVWLDYERRVIMPRVIRRSIARAVDRTELWPGTGNREDWRMWFSKEHPIRWAWA